MMLCPQCGGFSQLSLAQFHQRQYCSGCGQPLFTLCHQCEGEGYTTAAVAQRCDCCEDVFYPESRCLHCHGTGIVSVAHVCPGR